MSYFIGNKLKETAPHHESFEALWETKWKKPVCYSANCVSLMTDGAYGTRSQCSMSVYPFMFGKIEDFQPVVSKLIEVLL